MMKELIPGLFSFNGRMGRAEFWMLLIGLSVLSGLLLLVTSMLVVIIVGGDRAEGLAPLHAAAKALIKLLTLWPSLAILTKRGHDRNRPAVLSIGLWLVSVVTFAAAAAVPPVSLIGVAISLYFLVDYGLIPGSPGPNRYDGQRRKRSGSRAAQAALFD